MPDTRRDENAWDRLADRVALGAAWAALCVVPFFIPGQLATSARGQTYLLQLIAFPCGAAWLVARAFGRRPFPARVDLPGLALTTGGVVVVLSALLAAPPGFVAAAAGSGWFTPARAYSLNASLPWLAATILYFLFLEIAGRRSLVRPMGWALASQSAVLAIHGIAQHLGHDVVEYVGRIQKNPVFATFGHPNFFGSYVGPAFFVCLAMAALAPPGRLGLAARAGALGAAGLVAVALALARTRAVWIGCATGSLVAAAVLVSGRPALLRELRASRAGRAFVVGALALVVVAGSLAGRESWRRAMRLDPGSQWENRLCYWFTAASMSPTTSPLGVGKGGFGRAFWYELDLALQRPDGRFFRRNLVALTGEGGAIDPGHAHNDYVQLRLETGALGLFAHLAFVGSLAGLFAARLRRDAGSGGSEAAPRSELAARACLLAAFVCTLTDQMFGFPLSLPCSLILFMWLAAVLHRGAYGEIAP